MSCYFLEAFLKIGAMHKNYFKDNWNVFDFLNIALTIIVMIIGTAMNNKASVAQATIIRSLKIGRL